MEIGVVGLGRIGLPLALVLCKAGFQVKGIDLSNERIDEIKTRKEFLEPQLHEYLDKYGHRLEVSTDYSTLKDAPLVFIVAQTPSLKNGKFDLNFVESAVQGIHQANPEALIVVSSTINIRDVDKLSKMHRKVCYNPEFIKQGSIIHDFENPKFTLIGTYNTRHTKVVAKCGEECMTNLSISEGNAPAANSYSDCYDLNKTKRLFKGFKLLDYWTTQKCIIG